MPECGRCGLMQPSAELRVTTKRWVCKDINGCARRMRVQRDEERAENLRPVERRRVERALQELEAVRLSTKSAWDAAPLARVRAAREELVLWLENIGQKEAKNG